MTGYSGFWWIFFMALFASTFSGAPFWCFFWFGCHSQFGSTLRRYLVCTWDHCFLGPWMGFSRYTVASRLLPRHRPSISLSPLHSFNLDALEDLAARAMCCREGRQAPNWWWIFWVSYFCWLDEWLHSYTEPIAKHDLSFSATRFQVLP